MEQGLSDIKKKNVGDRPLFIVFEGLDGSGKSSHIRLLSRKLKEAGRRVNLTAEPTSSAVGGLIRDSLSGLHPRTPGELAALFFADRIAHNVNPVWGIKSLLGSGVDVLCDRYYYSSFAYQGLATDIGWLTDMHFGCPDILRPDLCIFLDVPPEDCKFRVDSVRAHLDIFEGDVSTLRDIRENFMKVFGLLGESENIRIVNAARPQAEVAADVWEIARELI